MEKTKINNIVSALFMYAVSFFFIFQANGLPEDSAKFPITVGWVLVGLTTLLLVQVFMGKIKASKSKDETIPAKFYISAILSTAYVLLVNVVGYVLLTPVYLFALILGLGFKNVKVAVLVSLVVVALVYLGFKVALGVPIPTGIFLS